MGALFGRLGLVKIAGLVLLYFLLSFLWSLTGFVSPTPSVEHYEYSFPILAAEILGHFSFGVVAGLATRRAGLAALCGAEAVLIDSDHLLAALGFPVMARLSHSALFALAIGIIFLALPQRFASKRTLVLVAISSILSHLSFDVFAGDGQFPLLAPFNFQFYDFPYLYWPVFELGAILLSALVLAYHGNRGGEVGGPKSRQGPKSSWRSTSGLLS